MLHPRLRLAPALFALLLPLPAIAQEGGAATPAEEPEPIALEGPAAVEFDALSEDARMFAQHVITLSGPYFGGRLPGTPGMEAAKDYIEYFLREAGLEAPFSDESGAPSFRQAFQMGADVSIGEQGLALAGGAEHEFAADEDFIVSGLGSSGELSAPMTFLGYAMRRGPRDTEWEDYESFPRDTDLTGRIAVILRFEPMDEDGKSRWATRSKWSRYAGLDGKVGAALRTEPLAIVVINPPGADDERIRELPRYDRSEGRDVPVIMMSPEGGDALARAADPDGRSLLELRRVVDEKGAVIPFRDDVRLSIVANVERTPKYSENVGGLLRGRGDLADELVVIGAHCDHLGYGEFGSRERGSRGKLHPGADDNASGTAGVMMLGEKLARAYAEMPPEAPRRSILFMAFNAEESGLHGSRAYVKEPIVPIEKHSLMINFDMIGRIVKKRLSVSGLATGEGFADWLQPFFDASPLEVVATEKYPGGSDHLSFDAKDVPNLFAIIADFHDDYHTPRDEGWKMNNVDAAHAIDLFEDIALSAAQRKEGPTN